MIKFKDLLKEVTEYPEEINSISKDGVRKHWQKEYDKADNEMAKARVLLRLKDSQKPAQQK